MYKKLGDIADLQFGPHEKGGVAGEAKYLLGRHFNKVFQPTKFDSSFIDLDNRTERFLLQPNDVILAGKGFRVFAWAYLIDFGKVVPSSLFYILRTNPSEVLGEYFAYYLNMPKIQYQLKTIGAGGTIPSIPKKELMALKILIPPLEKQKEIIDLANLLDKEIALTQTLLEQKKKLKKGLLEQLINKQLNLNKTIKKP